MNEVITLSCIAKHKQDLVEAQERQVQLTAVDCCQYRLTAKLKDGRICSMQFSTELFLELQDAMDMFLDSCWKEENRK